MALASSKIKDTGIDKSRLSRAGLYWMGNLDDSYKKWRKPALPIKINNNDHYRYLLQTYQLSTIEFGNWVNNESRWTYMMGTIVAMYDLDKILKFKGDLGMKQTIGIAYGSRGASRALAHFEPGTMMINITRYSREEKILSGGGVGSLAHEYGHALDYFFGSRVVGNRWSLTQGRTTKINFYPDQSSGKNKLQFLAEKIVYEQIWDGEGLTKTSYYEKLERSESSDYWFRHNELFARGFEQYIQKKLELQQVKNLFLSQSKYENRYYMDKKTFEKVYPYYDELVAEMRKYLP